jgi:hypothetical protein
VSAAEPFNRAAPRAAGVVPVTDLPAADSAGQISSPASSASALRRRQLAEPGLHVGVHTSSSTVARSRPLPSSPRCSSRHAIPPVCGLGCRDRREVGL